MKITNENEQQVRALIRVLKNMKVSQEVGMFIVTALQAKEQMDKLVEFIKNNKQATEQEILEKLNSL